MADNSLHVATRLRWSTREPPRCFPEPKTNQTDILNDAQKLAAFDFRERTRRQDLRYMQKHPEIRAITSMIIQLALKMRPAPPVSLFFADFFSKPREEIERELKPFIDAQRRREGYREERKQRSDQAMAELMAKETEAAKALLIKEEPMEKPVSAKDELYRNLIRLRRSIRMSVAPQFPARPSADISEGSLGSIDEELPSVSSRTSLVFSPSIEEFLATLQYKRGSEDQRHRESRASRRYRSIILNPNRVLKPTVDLKQRQYDERMRSIQQADYIYRRAPSINPRTGLYTVLEVDEPLD